MNLDEAIAKHAEWKVKFRSAMERKEQLDQPTIQKDNCCQLGQWLYGEGAAHCGETAEFRYLVAKHKDFHVEAGKVALLINARNYPEAEKQLAMGTNYSKSSAEVASAILRLKKVI